MFTTRVVVGKESCSSGEQHLHARQGAVAAGASEPPEHQRLLGEGSRYLNRSVQDVASAADCQLTARSVSFWTPRSGDRRYAGAEFSGTLGSSVRM
jgi:hypothetical protein